MEKNAKIREQDRGFAHLISEQREKVGMAEHLEKRQDSLAGRLKASDRSAAAELVDIYYEQIYLFMRRLGHSRQTSEDLTQESFLQAWQNIGQLRSGRMLNSWLYRIAGNVSKLYWRRHKHGKMVSIEQIELAGSSEADSGKMEHFEQLGLLRDAVVRLPIKLKQAVVLHYMQHLTIAEAAEAAGVREGTLKSRLNRALKTLKKQIA